MLVQPQFVTQVLSEIKPFTYLQKEIKEKLEAKTWKAKSKNCAT